MSMIGRLWRRGRLLLGRGRVEREMDEEMRFHVEMEALERMREGAGAAQAGRSARILFGGLDRFKEEARDARGGRALEDLLRDVRYGVRALGRARGFAVVAVVTLALGIGANAAIFSVVDSVLLRPLPYADAGALVSVWGYAEAEFTRVRESARSFDGVGAYTPNEGFVLTGGSEPERVPGTRVSVGIFEVLGLAPLHGRTFADGESESGRERVVILSHALWVRRYGGDASIVGREIAIGGAPHVVVGVMPAGTAFPATGAELWLPITYAPPTSGMHWGSAHLRVIGRLREGVTPESAREEVRGIAKQLRLDNPIWTPGEIYYETVDVVPLRDHVVREAKPMLLVLAGAVAVVLLIACANVANLLLARASAREREVAIRSSLGAGRARLVRQFLAESMVLAAVGGTAGLGLAWGMVRCLQVLLPPEVPRATDITVDGRVLLFAAVLSIGTGVAFGLIPSLRTSLGQVQGSLREGGRTGSSRRHRRVTGALVAAEVALSVVLVIGAGLLTRSFAKLSAVDPGFPAEQLVTVRLSPPERRYEDADRQRNFVRSVTERLASSPGVLAAGGTSQLPFSQEREAIAMWIDGYTTDPNALTMLDSRRITPGFLGAMRIPLVRGRDFSQADAGNAPGVALIDETAAKRYFQGRDPIGQRIRYPWPSEWLTIVGVVGAVKNNDLAGEGEGAFYVPYAQRPQPALTLVLRTGAEAGGAVAAARAAVDGVDPDVAISDVRTMQQLVSASVSRPRFTAVLLLGFALVALLLGAVGIYGVMAYAVTQRMREIGVRMALGARAADVLRMVVRQGAALAGAGIAIGAAAAFGLTRLLRGLLYGVSPTDPLTFVAVPALLASVALLASWLPSRRAARVDPMVVLRD